MADRPESIEVSCAHCREIFFVSAKGKSSASCPKCGEPLNPPNAGVIKRKDRKKSIPGKIETRKASSTFLGAPLALEAQLKDAAIRAAEKVDPKPFKEALAMSRMEMKLDRDLDLENAFFDPVDPFEISSEEPTVAISLSEVNDQTKPPPGIEPTQAKSDEFSRRTSVSTSVIPALQTAPLSIPVFEPPSEPETIPCVPQASNSETTEEKRTFRRGMKTSQLSDLLKKAKKEKQTSLKIHRSVKAPKKLVKTQPKTGTLSLNKSPTKPVINVPKSIKASVPGPSEDSLLIQLQALDKQFIKKPGLASENSGSGFIKLPTTDILDVLGKGQFRLRVQDIIYEPVDEKGLAQLIKGGVLLGAECIAEANGDWMPISEHPVFSELRKRMAEEAHSLLSKVATGKPEPAPDSIASKKEAESVADDKITKNIGPARHIKTDPKAAELEVKTAPMSKPVINPTMQMFAMRREEPASLVSPSLVNTIESISTQDIEPMVQAAVATEKQTTEDFEETSFPKTPDLTESEISVEKPKKKSAKGIFLVILFLVAALIYGVFYLNPGGLLNVPKTDKNAKIEVPEPTIEKEKKVEKKIDSLISNQKKKHVPHKKTEEVEPKKEEPKKEDIIPPIKIETTSFQNLQGAKFISNASGKSLALIFEKEGSSFLLIPETEKGGLNRILAAQKLCQLLACPFASNKVNHVTIDTSALKTFGINQRSILIKNGKINALIQPISKPSFSISETSAWRPILRASKSARAQNLKKWMAKKNLKLSNTEFSRQLGGILLRDFLVNDWNRFESKPSHIGIVDGKLVDQSSSVAFQARASGRVKGRFGWSSVYPAEMVANLEKLERKSTLELLFPNASTTDKSRFSVFWKQRSSALNRINALTAKSGKENVLLIK